MLNLIVTKKNKCQKTIAVSGFTLLKDLIKINQPSSYFSVLDVYFLIPIDVFRIRIHVHIIEAGQHNTNSISLDF